MKDDYEAKKKMLLMLKKQMMSDDDMGLPSHLKKVTVMADSPKEMAMGLDKAKDILQKRSSMMGMQEEEDPEDSLEDLPMEDEDEECEMPEEDESDDPAALKMKIAELQAKLAKK